MLNFILNFLNLPCYVINILVKIFDIVILLVCVYIIIKFIPNLVKKIVNKFFKYFIENDRKINTITFIVGNLIKFIVYFIAFFKLLDILGQPLQPIITLSGILGVALGFGSQSLVKDIITGVFILIEDQFFVGDMVCIGNIKGNVECIGIRTTTIRSMEGDLHIIPNGEIKIVNNMSKDYRRIFLNLVFFYKENIDLTTKILNCILLEYSDICKSLLTKPSILGVTNITENDFTITVSADCKVGEGASVERSMRKFIKDEFDKRGIVIIHI